MLKLWLRIQLMPDDSIMKQVHRELLALFHDGHDNWADRDNSLFVKFNVPCADLDSIIPNNFYNFLSNFRENRNRKFMIDWLRELNGLSPNCKLRTNHIFKTDFCIEPHLLCIQNKKHQWAMTRLRVSSHKLQIEAGRHSLPTVPIGDRLCTYCEQNVIDDENNFMMTCNFHDAERESVFAIINPHLDIRDHIDTMGKFDAILESRDLQVIKPLSRYVFNSFCKRGYRWVSWI